MAATLPSHVKHALKVLVDRLIRAGVPRVGAQIVRTLPHDRQAFTQGLSYHNGFLYESTGSESRSGLRCLDPSDGRMLREVFIEDDHAEGIAVVADRLVQLSWKSGRARVYHLPDLVRIGELAYDGEGWGLTGGPAGFIMSNGTSTLSFLDEGFKVVRVLHVRSNGIPIRNINDIEWVDRLIYANILGSTDIFEISLDDGIVIGILDCSALAATADPGTEVSVLNGIAYNRQRETLFVTGKHWPLLFEINVPQIQHRR
jgi:glutamine cyclotransferase